MKQQAFFNRSSLLSSPFLLLVLSVATISIHLTLMFKMDNSDRQITSTLFWATAAYLIWERKDKLNFQTSPIASLFGTLLLGILWIKSTGYCEESFLVPYQFLAGIALAAIASGFRGFQAYWRELTLLFFAGIPELIVDKLFNPSPITAGFASSLLWFSGVPVVQKGIYLHLPGGSVQVYSGCSGVVTMTQLLGMSVLFLMVLPLPWKWYQKLIIPVVAVTIAFGVNVLRVALMAVLVAQKQMATFEYWHNGSGSLIFSGIATCLLAVFVRVLIELFKPQPLVQEESEL
jgi:cyanoexosortase A